MCRFCVRANGENERMRVLIGDKRRKRQQLAAHLVTI